MTAVGPSSTRRSLTSDGPSLTRRSLLAAGALAVGGLAAACGKPAQPAAAAARRSPSRSPSTTASRPSATAAPPDPTSVGANELGVVPVLMHHRVTDHVNSEFDMTPAWFRAELERVHRERYYPVTTLQVARGALGHVPAGRSPVVLTFDDSSAGQLHYRAGRIAPDSAVGIMLDFAREHPDFPAEASFYLNRDPFGLGDPRRALTDLHRLGFEIGNHTYDHVSLGGLSRAQLQHQLAALAAMVTRAVPGVAPRTMALPLGVAPSYPGLVRRGASGGTSYVNEAVLLVGADPAPSPFHRDWNPNRVPRIRSSSYRGGRGEFLTTWWLDRIRRGEVTRYVSAGNPGHVTFPKRYADRLAPRFASRAVAY